MTQGCIHPLRACGADMSGSVVIFDCEHLTNATSPTRFWCGPNDPDPLLVQIGAIRLSTAEPYALGESFNCLVTPVGRDGPEPLPTFFQSFSGISEDRLQRDGLPLTEALAAFAAFVGNDAIWSWGKDEITSIAPACFVAGIPCAIPVSQFGNAAALLVQAGTPLDVVNGLRSHTLPAHFGLDSEARAHDGLADARGVARVLQHLLTEGQLSSAALRNRTAHPPS